MTYNIRAAYMNDAAIIAPLLREADKKEIEAFSGWTPLEAVRYSIENSEAAWYVSRPDGAPILVFGVGSYEQGGVPWMLGTPLVTHYGKSLVQQGRKWVSHWTDRYGFLCNYVDARNKVHIDWLTRIGFTVTLVDHIVGHDPDVPFYFFYRSN